MIDWNKTAQLNGMTEDRLRARFVRFPKSAKRVVAICDVCGKEREVDFNQYSVMCHKCSLQTPEFRKKRSKLSTEYYSDPAARVEMSVIKKKYYVDNPEAGKANSERMIQYNKDHPEFAAAHSEWLTQYHKDNPEVGARHSEWMIQHYKDNPDIKEAIHLWLKRYWANPNVRDARSDVIKNSSAHKAAVKKMMGGNDIVGHHIIYDHSDLSKHKMYITRSVHTMLHRMFQKHGIEIPHINTRVNNV